MSENGNAFPKTVIENVNLIKFLVSNEWQNKTRLNVKDFGEMGRGVYSKRDIMENDLLIELPYNLLISYSTMENDEEFIGLFNEEALKELKQKVPFQTLLAFYLCYQKSLGESSIWAPYLNMLPKSFTTPYFCTKEEICFLPDYILEETATQNQTIMKSFQALLEMLKFQEMHRFYLRDYKWSFFVCSSRCFFIDMKVLKILCGNFFMRILEDQPNMALLPFVDIVNHSNDVGTRTQLSRSEMFIKLFSDKLKNNEVSMTYRIYTETPLKKNEQIFINYGSFNNTKMLLEYGFFIPDNKNDLLEFTLSDIENFLNWHSELKYLVISNERFKLIKNNGLDKNLSVNLKDGFSHNFQTLLIILILPLTFYELPGVKYFKNFSFDGIQPFAIEFLERKLGEYQSLWRSLENLEELSESGRMCYNYFLECSKFIEKCLEKFEENS